MWLGQATPEACLIGFQRVEEPKVAKNRVHLDIRCDDVVATAARVEELGGDRARGFESGGFLVVQDPGGNEFCLLPREPLTMDEHGNVHYQF